MMAAALSPGTFVWIAVMGQWKWAMETLSVIVVAAPFPLPRASLSSRSPGARALANAS